MRARLVSPSSGRRLSAAVLTIVVSLVAGCGGGEEPAPVADDVSGEVAGEDADRAVPYGLVDAAQAAALATSGVTIVDVRTAAEFEEGHLDGALLIDVNDPSFADRIGELDPADEYLVYCRSGNRSQAAVAAMADIGLDRVWELDGGIVAYEAAGFAVTR